MNDREDICGNCRFFEPSEDSAFGECQNRNMKRGESPDALWPKRRLESVACGYYEEK